MSDEATNYKKSLLKKDKVELVKILKSKNQPTNGGKADLVDRILAYDEKNGGKMARKASKADADAYEDDEEKEGLAGGSGSSKPKRKKSKPKKNNNDDNGGGGGGGIDCSNCGGDYGPECGGGAIGIAQIATGAAAIGQLVLGILQFILLSEYLQDLCTDALKEISDDYECIGESLFWQRPSTDDHSSTINAQWRDVFTFQPSFFFTNWTPIVFGVIAMMQMFYSTSWDFVSGSWWRCMFWHVFLFLFAAFGYCGKAGIIIGFVQVFAAFMCAIMGLMRNGGNTYPMWNY